jgi:tetratricopeptide (TPR) repeat protein
MERFTRREVLRIVGLKAKQLAYWQRIGLVRPHHRWGQDFYDFNHLISLRTIKQLTTHKVPAQRLRRAIEALQQQLGEIDAPLSELRISSDGRQVVVEHQGTRLEPLSGQLLFDFETRSLSENIRKMPERTPEEWFALAMEWEEEPEGRARAIDAYRNVLESRPDWVEPLLNLGALLYEEGEHAETERYFRRAVELEPQRPLARFNLGSVLDEVGRPAAAREQLREALRLDPAYADAHYNLALVCEKLGAIAEARRHWRRYLELDPASPWAEVARRRLGPSPQPGR